jgi:hypothetical protein
MKKILLFILFIGLAGAIAGWYYYNKPIGSLKDVDAAFQISSDSLFAAYEMDEAAANSKFLDKTIEVYGKILAVNTDTSGLSLTLQTGSDMFGVICKLEDKSLPETNFSIGQQIRLKGQCTGFLMDVVLVRCSVVE